MGLPVADERFEQLCLPARQREWAREAASPETSCGSPKIAMTASAPRAASTRPGEAVGVLAERIAPWRIVDRTPARRRARRMPSIDRRRCPPHGRGPRAGPSRSHWLSARPPTTAMERIRAGAAEVALVLQQHERLARNLAGGRRASGTGTWRRRAPDSASARSNRPRRIFTRSTRRTDSSTSLRGRARPEPRWARCGRRTRPSCPCPPRRYRLAGRLRFVGGDAVGEKLIDAAPSPR